MDGKPFLVHLFYTLTLIGGVNWLVTGARILVEDPLEVCTHTPLLASAEVVPASPPAPPHLPALAPPNSPPSQLCERLEVPDLLSRLPYEAQAITYLVIGAASSFLVISAVFGYWVGKIREPLVQVSFV